MANCLARQKLMNRFYQKEWNNHYDATHNFHPKLLLVIKLEGKKLVYTAIRRIDNVHTYGYLIFKWKNFE